MSATAQLCWWDWWWSTDQRSQCRYTTSAPISYNKIIRSRWSRRFHKVSYLCYFSKETQKGQMTSQLLGWSIICLFTLNLNELRCFAAGPSGKTETGREFQNLILLYGTSASGSSDSSIGVGGPVARDVDTLFAPVPLFSLRWEEWRAKGAFCAV